MSEFEDTWEYDSESRHLYQDRPTQVSIGSLIRQTRAKTYSHSVRKGKDKGANKGPAYSEDEEATLPKVKKPTCPISLWLIVPINHPTRREDKQASLSLSGPQMFEFFGIRDGEMGSNLS